MPQNLFIENANVLDLRNTREKQVWGKYYGIILVASRQKNSMRNKQVESGVNVCDPTVSNHLKDIMGIT